MLPDMIRVSAVVLLSSCAFLAGCIAGEDLGDGAPSGKDPIASGTLSVVVGDGNVGYMLEGTDGQYVSLNVDHLRQSSASGTAAPIDWSTASGSPVDVFGTKNANGSIDVDTLEPSANVVQSASALVTTGTKRVLVMNVNFGSGTLGTDQDVSNVMTAAARNFADASFGKMKLQFDVKSGINVGFGSCAEKTRWMNEAKAAAQRAGANLANYQHFQIFGKLNCGYAGVGNRPGPATWIAALKPRVVVHELGHNFGQWHASSYTCTKSGAKVPMSDRCTPDEYGDLFDPMGHGIDHHYNASYKVDLGWIPAANVAVASGSRTYTLAPMTAPSSGLQLLRVNGPNDVMYQVEFRQPAPEDKFSSTDPNLRGVLIRAIFTQASEPGRAYLLDMSPDGDFGVAALAAGKSYPFFGTDTTITVVSTSSSGAQVRIDGASTSLAGSSTSSSLTAVHSGKCVGISGASTTNDAAAIQWPCTGALDQSWDFQDQGDNVVVLKNGNSGNCLDVPNGTTNDGATLRQSNCNGSNAQKWQLLASGDTVSLRSLASNKCVTVNAASTANGASIVQRDCKDGTNQQFRRR
jgi:Ricin-type beta-trefoil lectin domain-like